MIDLHCHSTVSDGVLSPAEVVQLAFENGCTLLALTDHDHTAGLAEARQRAQALGLRLINGVEISVTWRKRTIHIVGLDFDEANETLQNLLAKVRKGRVARFQAIADKLAKHGMANAYEGAMAWVTNPEMPSRSHLAQYLVQQGKVRNKQQAFKKYLGDGKSASVAHQWAELGEAVNAIKQANGIAVIAHPMRYDLSSTARHNLFREFADLGGQAIEVHSGRSPMNDRCNYAILAKKYGLMGSTGSDFHRPNDFSGGAVGFCPPLPDGLPYVWEAFR